jgi:hypothetical protein
MDLCPTAEMGVDGVSLPFYFCLYLNLRIFLNLNVYKMKYLKSDEIDSKHTKILMKVETCLWILKI